MLLISLESENGEAIQFEAAENWIEMKGLDERDEWPEDFDAEGPGDESAAMQNEWMENYYRAIQEMEECVVVGNFAPYILLI